MARLRIRRKVTDSILLDLHSSFNTTNFRKEFPMEESFTCEKSVIK